ncbi:MAG: universal stress protein [Variovorax sp.]|jgi:nucleotide-binding universal stress UspA family protein|nr:MAG: universal stress protein [Variovorax sp.]
MTTPRSILVHVDSSRHAVERVRTARRIAEAFDAQGTGMHCAVSAILRYPHGLDALSAEAIDAFADIDRRCHAQARAAFVEGRAGSERLLWEEASGNEPFDFARRACYADLLIVGQRDDADASADELPPTFLPSLLVGSGRPALVLPFIGAQANLGRRILIGWKETREAARAVSAALPWLRGAARVDAVCHGPGAADALARLAQYLRAHGVTPALRASDAPDASDMGERLLSLAADVEADLLVMGCYGHSRAREWLLGGATRTVLETMTLPVLMSH